MNTTTEQQDQAADAGTVVEILGREIGILTTRLAVTEARLQTALTQLQALQEPAAHEQQ